MRLSSLFTRQPSAVLAAVLGVAVLVLLALPFGRGGPGAFAHNYTHPGSGNTTHLHIDADITNGTRPCDPVDTTVAVPVGAVHQVGVCLEDYSPNSVEIFELHVHYTGDPDAGPPTTINVATEIADVAPALDDNPDTNDGDDPAGFRLGSGWDCTALGFQYPKGDDPSTVGVADAVIYCNANLATPDADLTADPGLLATIEFTASSPGVDTIDFGPIDASNQNAVNYPLPGGGVARCGTQVPADQIGCFGATIDKAEAGLYTVDTTSDASLTACTGAPEDCSLRGAISNAAGSAAADTITFDAFVFPPPPATPATIALGSALPDLSDDDDTIDATTAGVIVDGVTGGCFTISGDGNTITGLTQIKDCPPQGISITGAGNTIGGPNIDNDGDTYFNEDPLDDFNGDGFPGVRYVDDDGDTLIDEDSENREPGDLGYTNDLATDDDEDGSVDEDPLEGGMVIGPTGTGVVISGAAATGNTVLGNHIGAYPPPFNGTGLLIHLGAQNNTVGGTTAGERNVISGNNGGVVIEDIGTTGNTVKGNYIGTNAAGTAVPDPENTQPGGVRIKAGAQGNTIGGTTTPGTCDTDCNVISGNHNAGVVITGSGTDGNTISANYVGTDAAGTAAIPNSGIGLSIESSATGNTIGGDTAGERNVISGNGNIGVQIGASGNTVKGNYIGTNAAGSGAIANGLGVKLLVAPNNTIGGLVLGQGNTIAFNTYNGVCVGDDASDGNSFRGNSIHSNGLLGIDLVPVGQSCSEGNPTANDLAGGDPDSGPNNLQNFPVLTLAQLALSGSTTIQGALNSTPSTAFDLEFFYSSACDPSGNGEGENFLGSTTVLTNGSGDGPFIVGVGETVPVGQFITATATDPAGNTSEFSECIEAVEAPPIAMRVDMEPDTVGVQSTTTIDLDAGVSDFDIDIFVQGVPAPGLGNFSFDLVYEDSRVDATAVLEGPFLAGNGASTSCSVQNPDAEAGVARLACAVTGGTAAGGSGVLGTIEFDVLPIPGGDPLSFVLEATSLTDADLLPISHTTQDGSGDVIGVIETVAGTGEAGYYGDDGPATAAKLQGPRGVFETGTGSSTYFADTENHRVRKIDAAGIITLVAGNGTGDYCGENGPATSACLNRPYDVFVDGAGNVYIADTDNDVIRKVDTGGTITRVAGRGSGCGANPVPPHDGCVATEAVLDGPRGIGVDESGSIYIADTENHRIRRVDGATGIISTVAGNGTPGFSGDGGAATAASLNRPHDVYVYGELGDLVIADTVNNRIRRVDGFMGVIDTFAGSGLAGYGGDGGLATLAHLNGPEAVAVDSADSRLPNVLIADTQNNRIRRIDGRSAVITTVAGNGTAGSGGDGGPATAAQLNLPSGVAVGSLTVGDTENNTLRAIDPSTGKPSGRFSGLSCTVGSISTADWVLVGFVLGLVLARRRIRGLMMQIRVLAGLARRPVTPG